MPDKTTNGNEARARALADRLRDLQARRQRAAEAIREANNEAAEIRSRQDALAVAVVAEDEESMKKMADLQDSLLAATRRVEVSRIAVSKLGEEIARTEKEHSEAVRHIHLAEAEEYARERHEIAAQIEGAMDVLLERLEDLKRVDNLQRQQLYRAGDEYALARHQVERTIASWLTGKLGGTKGYLPLAVDYQHQGRHSLPELDPMLRSPRKSHEAIASIAAIEAPSAPRESDAAATVAPEEGHSPSPSQKGHTSPHGPGPDGAGSLGSEGEAATKRKVIRPPDRRVK
ncbi:MAG: hypothetical protein M3324_10320 [Actinomycetota bacterium]|nr:hypothetical protein [Actinomycetota bacterium]